MNRDDITRVQGEIVDMPQGFSKDDLTSLLANPGALKSMFNLTPEQATNLQALITGAGAAASVKYLSKAFGPEIAGALGAFAAAYLAKKVVPR